MVIVFYLRLVGFAVGALVYLFLMALILGHRRPRLFERLLFLLVLGLFLIYAGGLLEINGEIQYGVAPEATQLVAEALVALGLLLVQPLVWHAHHAYRRQIRGSRPTVLARPLLILLYVGTLGEFAYAASLLWQGGLKFGPRLSMSLGSFILVAGSALPSIALLDSVFEFQDWRAAKDRSERALFVWLFCVSAVLTILLGFNRGLAAVGGARGQALSAAILCTAVLPGALLIYFALKHNFLEYGAQRNLVYALSATFLALLYLALVRRLSGWFEPVLPPEATASILLFLLIFLFEPLERAIGPALRRRFQERVGRLQQLASELRQEARQGDVGRLMAHAEQRIRDEFSLASVRISVPRAPGQEALKSPGGLGHTVAIPLREGDETIGMLEAASTGAYLTGETSAGLEFLAEQLPAMVDLCRLLEEKLRLERELAERERMALLGQMAASVSHNLRNPLSSMKTVLQVQLENSALPLDVRRDCALVVGEIDRMSAKLTQLLRFAKPSVNGQRVGICRCARQAAALFARDAERRNVRLEFHQPAEDLEVLASEEGLNDVLANLIVNAIEAQPEGGRVKISVTRKDGRAEMEIEDEGPGILPELRSMIFQPYYTTKPGGTGLGLSIVARRVAEMGGTIACESPVENGGGTKFCVTLSLATP